MSASSRRPPVWAWLLAIPVVLVLLAWIALAVLFPPPRLRALVAAQLQHALARDARFGGASLRLWPPVRLAIAEPELAEPGGFARGDAFRARSVDLDLDVPALLGRRLRVRQLVIEEPALHLLLRADGSTNLDSLAAPAQGGQAAPSSIDLEIQRFRITGGRVLVDDLRGGRRAALLLSTDLSLATRQGGQRIATAGQTDIRDLAWGPLSAARPEDLERGLAKLVFHVEHEGVFDAASKRLALEKLTLQLGQAALSLSGRVDDVGPHARYDLRARGDGVDVAQLLAWAAVADAQAVKGIRGSGQLAFDISVRGSADARAGTMPALVGWLTLANGAFRYPGAPAEVTALSLRTEFAPDTITVRDLRASVAGQPLQARLRATRLADPLVDFALQGDLDLAAVGPLVPGGTQGAKLAGHTQLDVSGRGRAKDPGSFVLGGSAKLVNVSVEKPDLPSKVEGVNGQIVFSDGGAEARGITARAGKSSFTLTAKIGRPLALLAKPDSVPPATVSFQFDSPYLDLAELLPTTPGAPFLPNATGGGKVAIARLKQGKLDVTNVAADVVLGPATLSSPAFALTGYGGTIKGTAKFDLHDTRKPAYDIKTTVANVQANDLLSAWTPARDLIRGTLSTNLQFSGAGQTPQDLKKTLTLVGLAALSEGQLGPGPTFDAIAKYVQVPQLRQVSFHDLQLPLRIEQGRLVTDPVHLSGPSGDWKLSGAVGFDGALDYAVSVTLPAAAVAALSARSALAAGALTDDQGRMLLDLRVTGSAKSPRIAWDTRAMQDRLAGRASQALAEQRTKLAAQARATATQALAQRLGSGGDSTHAAAPANLKAAGDSLKKAASGLLEGFFGRKKTPPDTTRH